MVIKINNQASLYPLDRLPIPMLSQIKARLSFPNPAYQEAQKRGFSTWGIPQQIQGYHLDGDRLIIPRGFTRQLVGIIRAAGVQYQVEDHRRTLAPVDYTFRGELRDFQQKAVEAMASREFGVLEAPTGS